jgi:hypothetical protein
LAILQLLPALRPFGKPHRYKGKRGVDRALMVRISRIKDVGTKKAMRLKIKALRNSPEARE